MLSGVGRRTQPTHTLLLVPRKCHTLSFHSSCAPSGVHVLPLAKHHPPHISQGTPLAHVYQTLPLTCPTTRPPLPISPLPPPSAPFPSGIIDTIDAFSSASIHDSIPLLSDINASFTLRRYFRQRESARHLALFLASTSRPSRAHSVMSLAHALGCRFKPNHFETVVHQLSLNESWSLVPPLVSLARHQCGKTTTRLLNWKIRAFIECHRFRHLDPIIQEFVRENVQPTRRTFHLLVSGHLRNQDLDSAKRCLQLMEKAGFPVDASTHAIIVTAYRTLGLDPQVHARALQALPHVDTRTSTRVLNSIIQHFLDARDECSAAQHINQMISPLTSNREIHCRPKGTTTGADGAVSSLIGSSHSVSGSAPLIHPDAATFTILFNYLNNQRQFPRIPKLVNRMIEIGVKPDAGVVAALIRAHCLTGRDDVAMGLLAAMLELDANAAQSILSLFHLKGIPQLPIDVRGIRLTVHVFNAVLPRVMEIRGLSGARSIIRIMRFQGIRPNAATIEAFLNYLDRMRHINTGRLAHVLRSLSRNVHGLTIRHLNIVLRHALRQEKFRVHGSGWNSTAAKFSPTRIRRCMSAFPENRTVLTSADFDPGSIHRRSHDDSRVQPTVLTLSRKGVKSDRATFAMWLRHEGFTDPTLGTAKSVFRHMIDKGMHPNHYHFVSLMDGFSRAGDMQAAEQVMRSAKATGFEPDVVMWTVLISGHGRRGEPGLAMNTFRMMVAAGISPDVPAVDALAHAYFAVGAYSAARKVLLELWPQVKPFPSKLKDAPLKQLSRIFRQSRSAATAREGFLTPQEQRSFDRKLRQVLRDWRGI